MLKLSVMKAINKFKRANNSIEIPFEDLEISLIDKLSKLDIDKISTSWISNRGDLIDERNGLQVIINMNDFNKCTYLMVDLDRVKENSIFEELVNDLTNIMKKSKTANDLYIGYISKKTSNPQPDNSFSNIKEFIKFSKSSKLERVEAS